MYLTIMDYSNNSVTKFVQNEPITDVENLMQLLGYNISDVAYMIIEEEPDFSLVEISDILID